MVTRGSVRQKGSAHTVDLLTHPGQRVRLVTPPTYWRCEPGWSWRARPLVDYLLWHVVDGVGTLAVGGRQNALGPGTCVVFVPGDAPVAGHDPRRRLLVFGMHFLIGPAGGDVLPPVRWCQLRDQVLAGALARCCDASYRRGDRLGRRHSELCLEHLLCLLWEDAVHPAPGPVDAALDEITQAVRQDPGRRWSVAELARRASLSRAQFTRRFTARAGMSPARYMIRARIDRARQLLTETDMSVSQVAASLGYSDVGYFSRQYKRHTTQPPSRLRAAARGAS
jgi:AraC-like DNA-binding protein